MLIALNPFKLLHIYGPDAIDFYRGIDPEDDFDSPQQDDRATRCNTAQMPSDILENRRRSSQVEGGPVAPSVPELYKDWKVSTKRISHH